MREPSAELVAAIGSLIMTDPARIIAVARSLRGPDRSIESTVTGMSMGAGLPPGSRIRIDLVERDQYEIGEIVAYVHGKKVIVHRVVHRGLAGTAAGLLLTRGDAPLVPDPPVPHGNVLGPVSALWNGGAWVRPDNPRMRALTARAVMGLMLGASIAMLYMSPRATSALLTLLYRSERALRQSRASLLKPGAPNSPGSA